MHFSQRSNQVLTTEEKEESIICTDEDYRNWTCRLQTETEEPRLQVHTSRAQRPLLGKDPHSRSQPHRVTWPCLLMALILSPSFYSEDGGELELQSPGSGKATDSHWWRVIVLTGSDRLGRVHGPCEVLTNFSAYVKFSGERPLWI